MTQLQLMIDQLESQQAVMDEELRRDEQELKDMLEKGRAFSKAVEAKRERRNNLFFAITNLQKVQAGEEVVEPMATEEDPWGEAGK